MDKLTTAQLFAGYAPVVGGVALAAMSTTLAVKYNADLVNVSLAMFGGFVGGVAVVGAALSEIAYHWPRPVVSQVVSPDSIIDRYPELEKTAEMRIAMLTTSTGMSYRRVIPALPSIRNVTIQRWRTLAAGLVIDHRPLTVREWCGDGKPLSYESQYAPIIAYLERHNMIETAGRGVRLTRAGVNWFTQIIDVYSPLPR